MREHLTAALSQTALQANLEIELSTASTATHAYFSDHPEEWRWLIDSTRARLREIWYEAMKPVQREKQWEADRQVDVITVEGAKE